MPNPDNPGYRHFAYADPPYPGQAKALYGDHPDYAGEVDHANLIVRLETDYPDGWALSTAAVSLQYVLSLCPPGARVAAWYKTNSPPIRTTGRWIWTWEPVIVVGGRTCAPSRVRDGIACAVPAWPKKEIPGQKPAEFIRWTIELLGAQPGDTIDDLFPGSGAVSRVIDNWQRQQVLPLHPTLDGGMGRPHQAKDNRRRGQSDRHGRGV